MQRDADHAAVMVSVGEETMTGDATHCHGLPTHSSSSSMRLLGVRVEPALAGVQRSAKLSVGLGMSCS